MVLHVLDTERNRFFTVAFQWLCRISYILYTGIDHSSFSKLIEWCFLTIYHFIYRDIRSNCSENRVYLNWAFGKSSTQIFFVLNYIIYVVIVEPHGLCAFWVWQSILGVYKVSRKGKLVFFFLSLCVLLLQFSSFTFDFVVTTLGGLMLPMGLIIIYMVTINCNIFMLNTDRERQKQRARIEWSLHADANRLYVRILLGRRLLCRRYR